MQKKSKKTKSKKITKKEALTQKGAKRVRDREKVYKDFFKKLGTRDLKNRDYEDFLEHLAQMK